MVPTIILATRNDHKVSEIRSLMAACGVVIEGLSGYPELPDVEETGSTLEENAIIKARAASRATGLPAISDDTGLEVYFLGGAPGVLSARYAGDHVSYADNNRKLLRALSTAPPGERGARFRCIAAFVDGGTEVCFEGICDGSIVTAPSGENGFGYDPLFLPEGSALTFAGMSAAEKNAISHRASAFTKLAAYLGRRYPAASR